MRASSVLVALAAAASCAAAASLPPAADLSPPGSGAAAKLFSPFDGDTVTGLATAYDKYDGAGSAPCPKGLARLPTDLNDGLTADKMWLCAARGDGAGGAVAAVLTAATAAKEWTCPPRWEMVGPLSDMNSGAGGRYVFMCLRRADPERRERSLVADIKVVSGERAECELPWSTPPDQEGPVNLNEAAGGTRLQVCVRMAPDTRKLGAVAK